MNKRSCYTCALIVTCYGYRAWSQLFIREMQLVTADAGFLESIGEIVGEGCSHYTEGDEDGDTEQG